MTEYIQVNGQIIPQSEFYKKLAEQEIRQFAYDSQLSLFPDAKVESARKQIREQLDAGKTLDIIVMPAKSS
ncbi:MAG: hypothetical protein ACP5NW_00740 [Candidatus Woesearchaeota archaeon]